MAKASSKKQIEQQEAPVENLGAGVEEVAIGGADAGNIENEDLTTLLGDLESELTSGAVIAGAVSETPPATVPGETSMLEDLAALDNLDASGQFPVEDSRKEPQAAAPEAAPAAATPAPKKRISTIGLTRSAALLQALGSRAKEYLTFNLSDLELSESEQAEKLANFLKQLDDKTPIKIQEKVLNLFANIANGANLSNYTEIAIGLLVKDGELTSKTLKDAYLAHPYAEGTASSQTTQMMHLLPLVGLATRNGNKLVANPDSVLLPILSTK